MTGDGPLPVRTLDHCPACGSDRLSPLPMVYEHRGRFPLVSCRHCGLRFLVVQPTAAGLAELYGEAYFERDFRCGRSASGYFDEDAFREEDRGLLDDFERFSRRGRLLEVGCAGGWLLKHAAERGWVVQGVELSEAAVAHARTLGLEVFHGDLVEASLPAAHFDLAYLGDVLEHVPDSRGALVEVARVLKPGGVLYLRGPTTTNSLARSWALAAYGAVGRAIVLREPPYHLWEFTPGPLVSLVRSVGFTVVARRESKIPPGHAHGEKTGLQRAAMAAVDAVNLPLTRTFNAWGDRIVLVAKKRSGR